MRSLSSSSLLLLAPCFSLAEIISGADSRQQERLQRRNSRLGSPARELEEGTLQAYKASADLVAENIAGPGVTIFSATFQGRSLQVGLFSGGSDIVGLSSGAILSTGNIEEITGLNDGQFAPSKFDGAGFDPLTDLTGNSTHDAAVLTIMFQCDPGRRFSLKYVFGSEDYNPSNEGYAWEDVMGVYLNGLSRKDNIATVDGSYVSVKTINCDSDNPRCHYYVNNTNLATEMSGFTTVLSAKGTAYTGTNVLTIAIADGFDGNYPSWLLLGQGSMTCSAPAPAPSPVQMPSNGKDDGDKGEKVTQARACFKTLTRKCPCANVLQLQRCVKKQVTSNCVPPPAERARSVYIKGLTKQYQNRHCS